MSEGMLGRAIAAKRKHKADLEAADQRMGLSAKAAPVAAKAAPVNRNTAGPKLTTTAAKAAAQKAAIQKRITARVAANKGKVIKRKRNKGARGLRQGMR